MSLLPNPLFAGTAVTTTATFSVPGGAITDPSTIELRYKAGSAATVTWTYLGAGNIVRVSTGVYSAEIDTTGAAGQWQIEWVGTGACAAISVSTIDVESPPL